MQSVEQLLQDLKNGSIVLKNLHLLINNRERFLAIALATGHDKETSQDVLKLREHELEAFKSTSRQLDGLLDHCKQTLHTGLKL